MKNSRGSPAPSSQPYANNPMVETDNSSPLAKRRLSKNCAGWDGSSGDVAPSVSSLMKACTTSAPITLRLPTKLRTRRLLDSQSRQVTSLANHFVRGFEGGHLDNADVASNIWGSWVSQWQRWCKICTLSTGDTSPMLELC